MLAAHDERQTTRAESLTDHRRKVQRAPAVAGRAKSVQFMLPCMQAGDGAKVDHAASLSPGLAHRASLAKKTVQREVLGLSDPTIRNDWSTSTLALRRRAKRDRADCRTRAVRKPRQSRNLLI
jgi:hypothetical protein